ncbi:MAG: ribulose-phosphate 3-epimerase [Planctomycetaceae bacterium]
MTIRLLIAFAAFVALSSALSCGSLHMNRNDVLEHLRSSSPVIAPSMLKCDFGNLGREMERLNQADVQLIHWDVMDGQFVPNISYGAMVIERCRAQTDAPFDAHLMIANPAEYLDGFIEAGCEAITLHIEAVPEPRELLQRIQSAGCVAGLALNPDTDVETVFPFLDLCELALVMSVKPGFGGQKFMPEVLPKATALRKEKPELVLSIDGGIAEPTIGEASAAGIDVFVAGSAIFNKDDYSDAVAGLASKAANHRASQEVS